MTRVINFENICCKRQESILDPFKPQLVLSNKDARLYITIIHIVNGEIHIKQKVKRFGVMYGYAKKVLKKEEN